MMMYKQAESHLTRTASANGNSLRGIRYHFNNRERTGQATTNKNIA